MNPVLFSQIPSTQPCLPTAYSFSGSNKTNTMIDDSFRGLPHRQSCSHGRALGIQALCSSLSAWHWPIDDKPFHTTSCWTQEAEVDIVNTGGLADKVLHVETSHHSVTQRFEASSAVESHLSICQQMTKLFIVFMQLVLDLRRGGRRP